MKLPDIPMPPRIAALPREHRGLPIPFISMVDKTGRAHLTVNDAEKAHLCDVQDRCAICGARFKREPRWYVGGPGSAFHAQGAYLDPPVHFDCGRYALQVCPFIAAPRYVRRIEDATLRGLTPEQTGYGVAVETGVEPERPLFFVFATARRQHVARHVSHSPAYFPIRPWGLVEFWRHGARMTWAEARELYANTPGVRRFDELPHWPEPPDPATEFEPPGEW